MLETITFSDGVTLAGVVGILAFLWSLHRDIGELRERMARLEGLFEGFVKRSSAKDIE